MELSNKEFKAMNNSFRRYIQRNIELPIFKKMGLNASGKSLLELGCGSGYGAVLLSRFKLKGYYGIDLMPEQIALAKKRDLPGYVFETGDATNIPQLSDSSYDLVVIFGILHHIPTWRNAIKEVSRVLKQGGEFYIEEPDVKLLKFWDRIFTWDHSPDAAFSFLELENEMQKNGLKIMRRKKMLSFGWYKAVKL